ncbi:MAG: hypothetical protein U0003_05070 [Vampirovibrionales bacterium]
MTAVLDKPLSDKAFNVHPDQLPSLLQRFNIRPAEYDRIAKGLGRAPNFNELAMFSVLWSEHCCYKHSKHLLKTLPTQGVYSSRPRRKRWGYSCRNGCGR